MEGVVHSLEALATVQINLKSSAMVRVLSQALRPETRVPLTSKSKVKIKVEDKNIVFQFETVDTSSLRASISSYLRWVQNIQDVYNVVEGLK